MPGRERRPQTPESMDALVNAFLAIGLLVVIVLIVYLVDRVNSIEKETRRVAQTVTTNPSASQDPFFNLAGKKLWDALSGKAPEGLTEQSLQELRARYELVLHKHIQSLFEEGVKDGQRGLSGEPKNTRMIRTAKAPVESWIPAAQAKALYKCGLDSVQVPQESWGPIRAALDDAGQQLFAKVQLVLQEPLSSALMPDPSGQDTGAPSEAAPQPVLAPAADDLSAVPASETPPKVHPQA